MSYTWKAFCPECNSKNDGYTNVSGTESAPDDGDVSICAYCGTISWFRVSPTGTIKLERASEAETKMLMEDPYIRRALASLRASGAKR